MNNKLITCTKCGHAKPPCRFANPKDKKNGRQSRCIFCSNNGEISPDKYADKIIKSLNLKDYYE